MHLRSITLKGFKSFPDRTRLDFAPGVSVIVGPNGSGKSNVTDAVLWAMGEQSPVAVRGQSMQDVIFAGAHGVQARSEAEVEVVLDNATGAVDLPAGEISVVRRLNRAGEGEYRVNGARCRRAQLKLARTQDNLDRALDVEREARTRLRPLKRQAEAAELHERLERQTDEAAWGLGRGGARGARQPLLRGAVGARADRAAGGVGPGCRGRTVGSSRSAAGAAGLLGS